MADQKSFPILGLAAILIAIAFNAVFFWLGAIFEYPQILRQPPLEIMARFQAGGTALVIAWTCFLVIALMQAPFAVALSRAAGTGGGAVAALGVASALAQAIGLSRWVFAVPGLANAAGSQDETLRISAVLMFQTLHQFAGVAIGENIGQTLTALWIAAIAIAQWQSPRFGAAIAGLALGAALLILAGLVEGLATVLAFDPGPLAFATPIGYLVFSLWLALTGVMLMRQTQGD